MSRIATLAISLLLLAGVAHAQPTDVAKADTLFREARALMKSGDYETACPKLEESYRLDPAAGTGINLGDCFEKRGKVASALLAYQAARALLQPGDPRIGPVEKEIAALDKRTPRLTIKLAPGAPDGTTVKRDGREVEASKLGVPVAVNPGKMKVVVSAPGRDTSVFRVTLAEGSSRALEVGPGEGVERGGEERTAFPSSQGRPEGSHLKDADGDSSRWWFVGSGAVLLGVGTAAAIVWNGKYTDLGEICGAGDCPNQTKKDEYDKAKRESNTAGGVTVAAFGLGAAALVYGLFYLAPSGAASSTSVRAAPSLSAKSYVLHVEGAW